MNLNELLKGDRRALAKAITLIESTKESDIAKAQKLLEEILPHTGKSRRIAISGVPGVGKSTFIEVLGQKYTALGNKVAVLAVDPSSPLSGGSILGDKTRMENLSRDPNAFIRPSPTQGTLGGIAAKTREVILLCEAAGMDTILVETVGVGQSEYEVAQIVDCFILLMLPNAGDELQGIKKGILELADLIIVNKAEGEKILDAKVAKNDLERALGLVGNKEENWIRPVLLTSALEKQGLDTVIENIALYFEHFQSNEFTKKRTQQSTHWYEKLVEELVLKKIKSHQKFLKNLKMVEGQKLTPVQAAYETIRGAFKDN